MIKEKSVIAIIPARSGSKGLPDKNIRIMNSRPLLQWPILCAKSSQYIDMVVLSTDSEKYAELGKVAGALVPFLRPKHLSTDTSSSIDAILYTLEKLPKQFDIVVLLEATSPLTRACDLDRALETFVDTETAESMVSVTPADAHHPEYAAYIDSKNFISAASEGLIQHKPRQQLKAAYFPEGSFYISNAEHLKKSKTFYHHRTLVQCVERWQAPEIDDIIDFKLVETLFKEKQKELTLEQWQSGATKGIEK